MEASLREQLIWKRKEKWACQGKSFQKRDHGRRGEAIVTAGIVGVVGRDLRKNKFPPHNGKAIKKKGQLKRGSLLKRNPL